MPKDTSQKKEATYSSSHIVDDVKTQLKTAGDLYERYIEANAIAAIDPVMNAEFLGEGWSNNLVHKDTVVKEVEDTFSFIINLKNAVEIIINAAVNGDDHYLQPITLTLYVGNKEISSVELRYSNFSKYSFAVPADSRNNAVTVTGKLIKTKAASTIVIRSITAVKSQVLTDFWQESLFELEKIKRDSSQLLQFLEWHKNPELLLPGNPRKSFLKKVAKKLMGPFFNRFSDSIIIKRAMLKLMRPYTTPQIVFNQYLLEIINLQEKRSKKLEELLLTTMQIPQKKQNAKNSSVR